MTYNDFKNIYIKSIEKIIDNHNYRLCYNIDRGFYVISQNIFDPGYPVESNIKDYIVYFRDCDYQLSKLIYRYFWNWKGSYTFGILRPGLCMLANSSSDKTKVNCRYDKTDKTDKVVYATQLIVPGDEFVLDYSHYGDEFINSYVNYQKTELDIQFGIWQYMLARELNICS